MILRKLKRKDAPFMLEWMHDDTVICFLRGDFAGKTIDDCFRFITEARDETESIHLAIANDRDEYMGTVSLKHIRGNTAELGIALRVSAMGKGYASYGVREIMGYGWKNRGIANVYWCVDAGNERALRFYEKHGFCRCDAPDQAVGYTEEEKRKLLWYRAEK